MADFSLLQKLRECANRLFDRSGGVDAMLVVKVDGFNTQPAQACFAGAVDVIGFAANAAHRGVCRIADDAEFCGQHDLVALAFDCAAD